VARSKGGEGGRGAARKNSPRVLGSSPSSGPRASSAPLSRPEPRPPAAARGNGLQMFAASIPANERKVSNWPEPIAQMG
jgi:hypothetical protein